MAKANYTTLIEQLKIVLNMDNHSASQSLIMCVKASSQNITLRSA